MNSPRPRRIAVIVGSKSDRAQCLVGLRLLAEAVKNEEVDVVEVVVSSIHRNTESTFDRLSRYAREGTVDILIVGAGWANHLTGTVDAYLRNALDNRSIVVIGVAFENLDDPTYTKAAILSIQCVPGTQVIFDNFVGEDGFRRACELAVRGDIPGQLSVPPPRYVIEMSLEDALIRESW